LPPWYVVPIPISLSLYFPPPKNDRKSHIHTHNQTRPLALPPRNRFDAMRCDAVRRGCRHDADLFFFYKSQLTDSSFRQSVWRGLHCMAEIELWRKEVVEAVGKSGVEYIS